MISFVNLSILQLFDLENAVNRNEERIVFSTEGHIFPIDQRIRQVAYDLPQKFIAQNNSCIPFDMDRYKPPLDEYRLSQISDLVGIESL